MSTIGINASHLINRSRSENEISEKKLNLLLPKFKRNTSEEPVTDCIKKINRYSNDDVVDNPKKEAQLQNVTRPSTANSTDESKVKFYESMKYEINRLNTFSNKWPLDFIKPSDMAEVGLFYLQTDDKTQCAFCRGVISDWSVGDEPLKEHSKHFPFCPFLMGRDVGNVPVTYPNDPKTSVVKNGGHAQLFQNTFPTTSQTVYKPKFPAMADYERRLLTFRGWPLTMIQPPQLAEAGFYYTAVTDVVTCFFCGGSLGSWDIGDEPHVEHAKYFPKCTFIKLAKCGNSRQTVPQNPVVDQSTASQKCSTGTGFGGESSSSSNIVENDVLKSQIVQKASEIFSEPLVKEIVLKRYNDTKKEFASLQELCEELLETSEKKPASINKPPPIPQPKESKGADRTKKDILLCKICMDNEMGVVFVPCGHLIACQSCAREIYTCPLCRKQITSTVRAYMS